MLNLWIRDLGLQVTQQFCFHPWLVCLAGKYRYCLDSLLLLPRTAPYLHPEHCGQAPSLYRYYYHQGHSLLKLFSGSVFTFGWSPNCLKWHVVLSSLLSLFCLHSSPLPAAPTPHGEFSPHRTAWNSLEASYDLSAVMLWRGFLVACEFGACLLPIMCSVMSCWFGSQPWWEYLYQGNGQNPQIRAFSTTPREMAIKYLSYSIASRTVYICFPLYSSLAQLKCLFWKKESPDSRLE